MAYLWVRASDLLTSRVTGWPVYGANLIPPPSHYSTTRIKGSDVPRLISWTYNTIQPFRTTHWHDLLALRPLTGGDVAPEHTHANPAPLPI